MSVDEVHVATTPERSGGAELLLDIASTGVVADAIEYLYLTVAKAIVRSIMQAGLRQGQQLPPRDHLTAAYHVSAKTVQRAVQLLQEHGVLVMLHGRGTFVATDVDEQIVEQVVELLHRQAQREE